MKGIISIVLISLLVAYTGIEENVNSAIRSGNASALAEYFNKNIDLTVLEKENVYSKAQAEIILKEFFAKHKPTALKLVHEGNAQDGSKYIIAKLTTVNGRFRIYYLIGDVTPAVFKETNQQYLIHKLKIDTDEDE